MSDQGQEQLEFSIKIKNQPALGPPPFLVFHSSNALMLPSPSYPTVYFSLHLIVLIFKPRNAGLSNKTNRSPSHAFDPVQVNPMAPHFDTVDVSGWQ